MRCFDGEFHTYSIVDGRQFHQLDDPSRRIPDSITPLFPVGVVRLLCRLQTDRTKATQQQQHEAVCT